MHGYLKERQVRSLYVCGLAADYCVFFTARDALKNNFQTFIIEDATRPISKDGFENAKKEMDALGGFVVNSDQILVS